MLQEVSLGWLVENQDKWANEGNSYAPVRCAYIDSEGLFQLVKVEIRQPFGGQIWARHISSLQSYLSGDYRDPQSIFYIDALRSSGEGVAAAPTPSDDAPNESLEAVAGDLLAVPARRQTSNYPDHLDDDIQAGIPLEIEDAMWAYVRAEMKRLGEVA